MATVTKENIGLLNEKIIVTVEKDDYLPSFEKAIKSYTKNANIPGFRKGMVPTGMVKKMYGSSVFADEVIKSVEKNLQDYMVNEKLEIFAQPLPLPENDASKLDMNKPSEYAFSFEIGVKPEFSLPDFASMNLTKSKIIVTEEAVIEAVNQLLKEHRIVTETDSVPAEEYELSVKLIETDQDGNETAGGINRNYYFYSTDFTPSFNEQLTGKKKDDDVIFQPSTALDEKSKDGFFKEVGIEKDDAKAAEKSLQLVIEKINATKNPAVDTALFEKVFPGKEIASEQDFRNEVKVLLEQQWEGPSRNQLHDQLFHQLVDHTHIPFPENFLKRWMLNNEEKTKTQEEVDKEYPNFIKSLQWSLITDKIMQENNIQVSPEEIESSAKGQLMGYFSGNMDFDFDQPWVNDYVQRMMKDKKFVEDTARRIEMEKVFAWCETLIHPIETPVSVEDFTKLQAEHQHSH